MLVEERTKEMKFSEVCLGDIVKFDKMYFLVTEDFYCADGEVINVINLNDGFGYYIKDSDMVMNLTTRAKVIIEG